MCARTHKAALLCPDEADEMTQPAVCGEGLASEQIDRIAARRFGCSMAV